jgi:hypothetical protein
LNEEASKLNVLLKTLESFAAIAFEVETFQIGELLQVFDGMESLVMKI